MTSLSYLLRSDRPKSREYQSRSFFDDDEQEDAETNGRKRSMSNTIVCPVETHECRKLHGESRSVCCPLVNETDEEDIAEERQQTSKSRPTMLIIFDGLSSYPDPF